MKFKQACSEVVSDIKTVIKNIKINNLFLNVAIIFSGAVSFVSYCGTWLTFFIYWFTDKSELPFPWMLSPLLFVIFLLTYFLMKVLLKMEKNL